MRRDDSIEDVDAWVQAWRVTAETRDEALDLAGLAYVQREVRSAISDECDRLIAEAATTSNAGID